MLHYDYEPFVKQTLANKVTAVINDSARVQDLSSKIWEHLCKSDSNLEPSFFKIDEFLCFLDSSSKLPSALLTNKLVMTD